MKRRYLIFASHFKQSFKWHLSRSVLPPAYSCHPLNCSNTGNLLFTLVPLHVDLPIHRKMHVKTRIVRPPSLGLPTTFPPFPVSASITKPRRIPRRKSQAPSSPPLATTNVRNSKSSTWRNKTRLQDKFVHPFHVFRQDAKCRGCSCQMKLCCGTQACSCMKALVAYHETMGKSWETYQTHSNSKPRNLPAHQTRFPAGPPQFPRSQVTIVGPHVTTHVTARSPCLNHKTVHDASHWVIIRFVSFLVASAKEFWGAEPTSLQECQLKDQKHPKAINSQGIEKAHLSKQIHKSMDRRINRLVDR